MKRLTLGRQLMLLQLLIVALVVAAVVVASVLQTRHSYEYEQGRKLLATAEATAGEEIIRHGASDVNLQQALGARLEWVRATSGASYVLALDRSGRVITTSAPTGCTTLPDLQDRVVLGASWSGSTRRYDRQVTEAQVPILGDDTVGDPGSILGYLVIGQFRPSVPQLVRTFASPVIVCFLLASLIGVLGALIVTYRVKRQTLGLEPADIAGLMTQRDAMLHGIHEGIVGVDLDGTVTFANDQAIRLLGLPDNVVGRSVAELHCEPEVGRILRGGQPGSDLAASAGSRMLLLNSRPVTVGGRQIGWVTSMRDRTDLVALREQLGNVQAATDTLRAQVHEFRNRLHVIAGMVELRQLDSLRDFIHTLINRLDGQLSEVSEHIADPAVAALLLAKNSRAAELGIDFRLEPVSNLDFHDPVLSADVVTVVGNLIDNAMDVQRPGLGSIAVTITDTDSRIDIMVRDQGPGIAPELAESIFRLGSTTKQSSDLDPHGFGLALARMACRRHGGEITVESDGGAVFRAHLLPDMVRS